MFKARKAEIMTCYQSFSQLVTVQLIYHLGEMIARFKLARFLISFFELAIMGDGKVWQTCLQTLMKRLEGRRHDTVYMRTDGVGAAGVKPHHSDSIRRVYREKCWFFTSNYYMGTRHESIFGGLKR